MKKIILASSSPRRIEMMKQHGYQPVIRPADVDETLHGNISPEAAVMYLAFKKAAWVASYENDSNARIIAADTVVVFQNRIIGKPADRQEAWNILSSLRSNHHSVITGVCILDTDHSLKRCFYEKTAVYFKPYTDVELSDYLATSEPYDKAGGYAIQGTFQTYIDHIEGDYNNVVGFPWAKIQPYL